MSASDLHHARVLLAQARAFREREKRLGWSGSYSAWLLECVGRARREMLNQGKQVKRAVPIQSDLFAADCAAADASCYP